MAAVVSTPLASLASTTNAASYVGPSFTPTVGDLLVVVVSAPATLSTPTLTASANGLTFTLAHQILRGGSTDRFAIFVADQLVPGSPAAMTLTANFGADAASGCHIIPLRVTGMTNTGTAAILQTAGTDNNHATGATVPSESFAAAPQSGNPVIAVVANNSNPAGVTQPSGWTEVADVGFTTPNTGVEIAKLDSAGSQTVTWGSNSTAGGVILIELDASAGTSHALTASGSTATDGVAAILATRVVTASGSTTTDGVAAPRATRVLSGSGSTTTSGAAAVGVAHPVTASGSTATSGAAAILTVARLTASGSTSTSGAAALVTTARLTASGSATTGGNAAALTVARLTAAGTATTTGAAALTFNATLTAFGATTTGGSAAPDLVTPGGTSHALTGSGAATTTGNAAIVRLAVLTATGSTTTTGTAAPKIRAVITATGSSTTDGIAQPRARRALTSAGLVTTLGQAQFAALLTLTASGLVTTTGSAALDIGGPSAPLEPAPPERTRVLNISPRHRVLEDTARDRLAQAQDRLSVLTAQNRSGTL